MDDEAWRVAWGAISVLREVGDGQFPSTHWPGPRYVLVNDGHSTENLHGHCERILNALSGIADKKDWNLDISLDTLGLLSDTQPFDLSSRDWQTVRGRVRSVSLKNDSCSCELFDEDWLDQFLQACPYIESLTLDNAPNIGRVLRRLKRDSLRHLSFRDNRILGKHFTRLLQKHASTLENITCEDVRLSLRYWYVRVYDAGDSEDDDEAEEQDPSWFSMFKIMLTMPCLMAVRLSWLSQDYSGNYSGDESKSLKYDGGENVLRTGGAEESITAYGDAIARKLGLAIEELITTADMSYSGDVVKAWFPKIN